MRLVPQENTHKYFITCWRLNFRIYLSCEYSLLAPAVCEDNSNRPELEHILFLFLCCWDLFNFEALPFESTFLLMHLLLLPFILINISALPFLPIHFCWCKTALSFLLNSFPHVLHVFFLFCAHICAFWNFFKPFLSSKSRSWDCCFLLCIRVCSSRAFFPPVRSPQILHSYRSPSGTSLCLYLQINIHFNCIHENCSH